MPLPRRLTGWLAALAAIAAVVVWMRGGKIEPGATPAPVMSPTGTAGLAPSRAPRLEAKQAKAYAEKRQADAICLLALGRATGDPSWLQRALAEHPDDPRVQLERWNMAATPEEKLAAARALQAAAPDNPLGAYLEAGQAFDNRDLGAVARLMVDASLSRTYDAYTVDILLETQAAFRAGGLDEREAWAAAGATEDGFGLRTLADLRRLGDDMGELQHIFVEMGYWDEADFMFERTLALGEQLQGSGTLIESLAGIALQSKLLNSFDSAVIVSDDGTRAGQRLAELEAAKSAIRDASLDMDTAMRTVDDAGWEQYRVILRQDGELAAIRWLRERK